MRSHTPKVEAKIVHKGSWDQIEIVIGWWLDGVKDYHETELMTFGKCFYSEDDAKRFMKTSSFKTIFKAFERNSLKILSFKNEY